MFPKITVLIPSFNRERFLKECLDSVLAQTVPAHQIIFVNDGSTDGTAKVLAPYRDKVEYFETLQLGKPSAINFGLKYVTGDYLWIFDDDDVALPDALERFVQPLEDHPEYGFSYSTFFFSSTDEATGKIGRVLSESSIPDVDRRGFLPPLLEGNFLGGAALFARTVCYEQVGNFDPKLLRSQDYEMAIRIALKYKGIRVKGGSTFHYRQHGGQRGCLQDRFDIQYRNDKWLEYDRMFFHGLYGSLPLSAYLPPAYSLDKHLRQALLQRIRVLMSKLLFAEVIKDFQELSRVRYMGKLSELEREIVRGTFYNLRLYYKTSNMRDYPDFFRMLNKHSGLSMNMLLIRMEFARKTLGHMFFNRQWAFILKDLSILFDLCLYSGWLDKRKFWISKKRNKNTQDKREHLSGREGNIGATKGTALRWSDNG